MRQPDHEYEERSFGDIQRAIDFENSMNDLESQLYYRARSGKCWHPGSLRGMVGNLTYMGVLRCGDARSELMPELQIIPQEEFEAAQRIREDRSAHAAEEAEHHVPLRTRGQALLSNNVYCGHCGARLALTTSRKWRKLSDGTLDDTLRIRYTCYGKLRKQTDCTGQTGYTMHILDEIIDKMVRQIFSRLRGIPKEQLSTKSLADLFFFMNNQFSMFFPMVLFILIGSLFYQEYKNKTYINWITYGFSKKKI